MKVDNPISYMVAGAGAGLYLGLAIAATVAAFMLAWWAGVIVSCLLLGFTAGALKYLALQLED